MTPTTAAKSGKSSKPRALELAGKWRMWGHSTEVGRFEWEAILILYRKRSPTGGTLEWRQTKGANTGAHRQGNWTFNGKTLTLRWLTTHGTAADPERRKPLKRVQTVWTSSKVTSRSIKEGSYTVEYALPGVWEAEKIISQASPLIKGKWKMMGHSHLKEYWEAKLTLHARGGVEWKQVKGAITTRTRKGLWTYDGRTLKLDWYAPGGGQTEWLASSITGQTIANGRYTVEHGVSGDWWAEKLSPHCCPVKKKSHK